MDLRIRTEAFVWMLEACSCVDGCACLPACPNNIIKCKRCIPAKAASPKAGIEQVGKLLQCPQKGVDGSDWKAIRARLWSRISCVVCDGCRRVRSHCHWSLQKRLVQGKLTDFLVPLQVVKTESTKLKPVGNA